MSLREVLIRRNVATRRQVEQALALQAVEGGDLVTCLLDVSRFDEGELLMAASEAYEAQSLEPGTLGVRASSALGALALAQAMAFTVVPLDRRKDAMVVATSRPLSASVVGVMQATSGLRVEQRLALDVRIREAMSSAYGIPLDERTERLLVRLQDPVLSLDKVESSRASSTSRVAVTSAASSTKVRISQAKPMSDVAFGVDPVAMLDVTPPMPSVVLSPERDAERLVAELLAAGNDGKLEHSLVAKGPLAVNALMARFPGPAPRVHADAKGRWARPSSVSAVMRVLARLAVYSVKPLALRASHPDSHHRYWAVALLAEMAHADGAFPLLKALADEDNLVRQAALRGMPRIWETAPEALRHACNDFMSGVAKADECAMVMRGLGEARVPIVDSLVRALEAGDSVAREAVAALRIITARDFGADASAWTAWWTNACAMHRVEWLLAAFDEANPGCWQIAYEELRLVSNEQVLARATGEKNDWIGVQQHYRDWWHTRRHA